MNNKNDRSDSAAQSETRDWIYYSEWINRSHRNCVDQNYRSDKVDQNDRIDSVDQIYIFDQRDRMYYNRRL